MSVHDGSDLLSHNLKMLERVAKSLLCSVSLQSCAERWPFSHYELFWWYSAVLRYHFGLDTPNGSSAK
jgi:hypothetical protein